MKWSRKLRFLFLLLLPLSLSACAEVKAIFSVLFHHSASLNSSSFGFEEIRSGSKVACSMMGDKTLRCLGSGVQGSLGTYNGGSFAFNKKIKQIALGRGYTCYIEEGSTQVFCFGRNDLGQLGNGQKYSSLAPVAVLDSDTHTPLINVKKITAGESHACAILTSGRAVCWGDNSLGQAGNPTVNTSLAKTVLESEMVQRPFQSVHDIYAGANSTCIIAKEDSSVYCFGERYKITDKDKIDWVPSKIEINGDLGPLTEIKQIGVGKGFACGLTRSAQVFCWGRNDLNQLGSMLNTPGMTKATRVIVTYPEQGPLAHIEQISVGENHACALQRDEKTVFCWGSNADEQLGNTSVRGFPEQVALGSNNLTLKGVKSVEAGPDRTCIISSRDESFCWGNGVSGLLGNERVSSAYPVRTLDANGETLSNVTQIAMGYDHTCVLDQAQRLYCYGVNEYGQLGNAMISSQAILSDKVPITNVIAFDTYGLKTCLIEGENQTLACFGERDATSGKKAIKNIFIPEEVTGLNGLLSVSVGLNQVCVISAKNQQVSCSKNESSLNINSFKPVLDRNQKKISDIWQIRSREEWTCGLTQEKGEIWCWGKWKNEPEIQAQLIPTKGSSSAEYLQVALSGDQICGIRGTERALYCTKIGVSLSSLQLEPVEDSENKPMTKTKVIAGGLHHFCAINDLGYISCWGQNDYGQLGIQSDHEVQKATRVHFTDPRLKILSRLSAGDHHTCVSAPNEPALFCFGESFFNEAPLSTPKEYPL